MPGSQPGMGLKRCNGLIHRGVVLLYKKIGDEQETVYFERLAFKYRISNNLLQDTKNFQMGKFCSVTGKNRE